MSRGLSTAVVNALKSDVVRPVTFAKLDFSSSTMYVHDSIGTFTWGGNDWLGVGDSVPCRLSRKAQTYLPIASP